MTIEEFCLKRNITRDQFLGREVIKGSLFLSDLVELPDEGICAQFNPIIEGSLWLDNLKRFPNISNLNVKNFLSLHNLTHLPNNVTFNVGYSLDLQSLISLPQGIQFNVGWDIYFNKDIICGDIICKGSVKESLRLMLRSTDKEIQNLAVNGLWKYRTVDIMEITEELSSKFRFT